MATDRLPYPDPVGTQAASNVDRARALANGADPDQFIPAIKEGRKIIFDRNDLDAYMDRKKDS